MFIEERLARISAILTERGKVTVADGARELGVSPDTIRRDFDRLLSENHEVLRTHGGVLLRPRMSYDPDIKAREVEHRDEKEAIARAAAELIQDSEIVFLDAGTTTERIVKHLNTKTNLTILTDAINIAAECCRNDLATIIIGGTIRNSTLSVTGPDAVDMIRHYHVDKLFLGASALSLRHGLMSPNRSEAELKKELTKSARMVILVADHSKIDQTALCSFASIDEIHCLVTDGKADDRFLAELTEAGVRVIKAS